MLPAQAALSRVLAVQPLLDATGRDQATSRTAFAQLVIGQSVTGKVQSVTNGISLVDIQGETVAMRLPEQTAPGDNLRLRFAGRMPQLVFMLETPEAKTGETAKLSQTARLLSDIMQRVPERGLPTLTPPGALLGQPPTHPSQLALALRSTLVRSGLFYESHLASWAIGKGSLSGLMQEPQNRLAAEAARSAPSDPRAADPRSTNPMHTLLSQQLQVLETPHFGWRGELWPGQPLDWQVRRGSDPQPQDAHPEMSDEDEAAWESSLKLTLPQLGTVNVQIKLDSAQNFRIRMMPEQSDSSVLMQANRASLVERLTEAGCSLHSVAVEPHADA